LLNSEEWNAAREQIGSRLRDMGVPSARAFALITPALACLVVAGFFISGCNPTWRFARIQVGVKAIIAAGVIAAAIRLWAHSNSKRGRVIEMFSLGTGASVGMAPMWIGWLTGQLQVVNVIHRSCPTGVIDRSRLLVDQILPALWGIPSISSLRPLTWWQVTGWLMIGLLAVSAIAYFVISRRDPLARAWSWSSVRPQFKGDLAIFLLFLLSLALSVFGNNTVDVYSVRHMLMAWLASSVMFAIVLDKLLDRSQVLGAVIAAFWIGVVAIAMLESANGNWRVKFTTYPQPALERLVTKLDELGVSGGYADYWGAYTLDYLADERMIVAPYNGLDRYPAYTKYVSSQERIAFILPAARSPVKGAGIEGLVKLLRLPNDISGEGPARDSIINIVLRSEVEERLDVEPWDVWILTK
jgi:hypothetical protein